MDHFIVQTVRVSGRSRHFVRGVVHDVPDKTTVRAVTDALDAAGLSPSEAGIPWANHSIKAADKLPANAEHPPGPTPEWTWEAVTRAANQPQMRQLNVRIPKSLHKQCEDAAFAAGVKLRPWVESALAAAVAAAQSPGSTR